MVTDWIAAFSATAAAVGTVGTLGAALVQIKTERDERKRLARRMAEREQRRQAETISGWLADDAEMRTSIALSNQSEAPVYMAIVSLVMVQGSGPRFGEEMGSHLGGYRATLSVIPPGRCFTTVEGGWGGMSKRAGVEIAFTDTAGRHWIRRANGALEELEREPPAPLLLLADALEGLVVRLSIHDAAGRRIPFDPVAVRAFELRTTCDGADAVAVASGWVLRHFSPPFWLSPACNSEICDGWRTEQGFRTCRFPWERLAAAV
jgi:hypothetical protein